jgi:FMN phosphatase YigB (HAD superfamily)
MSFTACDLLDIAQLPGMAAVTEISLILFDLNGVLYHYQRDSRIDYLAKISQRTPAAIKSAIWDSGFEDTGDAGALGADAYLRDFGSRIGIDLSESDWVAALQTAITPIQASLALLPLVRSGVTCAVLTNNNLLVQRRFPDLYPEVATRVGNRAYVSAEFGASKPDPDAYRSCLARLGVAPEAALFIDDSAANVAGARTAGLSGYHADNPESLTAELRSRGLLA